MTQKEDFEQGHMLYVSQLCAQRSLSAPVPMRMTLVGAEATCFVTPPLYPQRTNWPTLREQPSPAKIKMYVVAQP